MCHHLAAVGDEEHGPSGAQPLDGAAHVLHARGIEIGRRLVEDDERRIPQEGARQADPPALARRQRPPAVARLGAGRTMLLIAHRPELVMHADRIVRLEAGAAVAVPARWAA